MISSLPDLHDIQKKSNNRPIKCLCYWLFAVVWNCNYTVLMNKKTKKLHDLLSKWLLNEMIYVL